MNVSITNKINQKFIKLKPNVDTHQKHEKTKQISSNKSQEGLVKKRETEFHCFIQATFSEEVILNNSICY